MEDEATQAKRFDNKEKQFIALEHEAEDLKEKLAKQSRAKAVLGQGIEVLSQKLGIERSGSLRMPETLNLCDKRVKELLQ